MSIIAKYKFDKTIYADLLPEFNAEFTSDLYNTTDEEVDGIITRTIESNELPTLMRFGSNLDTYVEGSELALLEILEMNTSGLTTCLHMFRLCKNLTSITCEWDTSNVTNMYAMFHCCNKLTTLDVSNFDTSNVTTMRFMFYDCTNLTSLDVSNWDTSKVDNMQYMFSDCTNLITIDVSNWDTSNVDNMQYMFQKCSNLTTLDVSNFNTSKVTDMSSIFNHCYNLTSLDVSNFDTSKVTNMTCMFNYCQSLISLDVSNFDISKVIRMDGMFSAANKLISLDISNFNISDTTNIDYILSNTPLLTDIGMLYCDQSTINKIASVLPTDITQTIWVEDVDVKDLTPVEGVEFKQYAKNTEIMLTSPLLEGDKLVVKDGKTYHYHKMGMIVLDGSENYEWKAFGGGENGDINRGNTIGFYKMGSGGNRLPNQKKSLSPSQLFSDRFKVGNPNESYADKRCMTADNTFNLCFYWNELPERTSDGVNQWLQQNPTTVVYELEEPYYELISEDSLDISLIAESSDITNSSNIPLNMTINNKGLSTIAMSPSTTYTVAFDKDTDSEVVVNLCGNEITTTDNVVEITTPSEIDDELIFYGDGVEVSNVRLLEGSVSGDSIPRESFEGLKSSFEDGYIPESELVDFPTDIYLNSSSYQEGNGDGYNVYFHTVSLKTNTVYTVFCNINEETTCTDGLGLRLVVEVGDKHYNIISGDLTAMKGVFCSTFTLTNELREDKNLEIWNRDTGIVSISNMVILEGDWTHLTEEDFNNLGKYKVEYKVTGKNLAKLELSEGYRAYGNGIIMDSPSFNGYIAEAKENTTYTISNYHSNICYFDKNMRYMKGDAFIGNDVGTSISSITTPQGCKYISICAEVGNNLQIEEGSTATEYEPYKSYTKTFYLNSPLLEGDTIQNVNGIATHVHRYGKVVLDGSEDWVQGIQNNSTNFYPKHYSVTNAKNYSLVYCDKFMNKDDYYSKIKCVYLENNALIFMSKENLDDFKQWLQANPITVAYQLASPQYEPISTESILCDSYVNGHLDVDSNVPIEKVEFKHFDIPLVYSHPNTMYKVQFEADNNGTLDNLDVSGGKVINTNIVKGLNRFTVTTPNKLLYNWFTMSGIGFNASNIQVVATDRNVDFGYFKGLSSSFEEKIYNGDDNLFNKNSTIYEGLNEDITMKWFVIEKPEGYDCITIASKGETIKSLEFYESTKESSTTLYGWLNAKSISHISEYTYKFTTDNPYIIMAWNDTTYPLDSYFDRIVIEKGEKVTIDLDKIGKYKVKCKVVGKNKFDKSNVVLGYWGTDSTTYHTNIPSVFSHKTPIKVKPNTWYTMQSLGVAGNVYVVGLHPFESILVVNNSRASFYTNNRTEVYIQINTENTDLSKFLDIIQIEEGTQATPYEPYQEYTKTIHLNSPLLKGDTIEVHNGKLCHYHKMNMVVLDGSEGTNNDFVDNTLGWYRYNQESTGTSWSYNVFCLMGITDKKPGYGTSICDKFLNTGNPNPFYEGHDKEFTYTDHPELKRLYFDYGVYRNDDSVLDEWLHWLSQNPVTVVYELVEPYYEEITPIQEDLIITSVKEGDLHIDTIVPISSKVTYNVNVQLLTDFEQSIVEQVQTTQTTDLQSILDEEIDN